MKKKPATPKHDFNLTVLIPVETKVMEDVTLVTTWQVNVFKADEGEGYITDRPQFLTYMKLTVGQNTVVGDHETIANFVNTLKTVGIDAHEMAYEDVGKVIFFSIKTEDFVFDTTGIKLPKI